MYNPIFIGSYMFLAKVSYLSDSKEYQMNSKYHCLFCILSAICSKPRCKLSMLCHSEVERRMSPEDKMWNHGRNDFVSQIKHLPYLCFQFVCLFVSLFKLVSLWCLYAGKSEYYSLRCT